MENRKGLSTVVATLIIILLVLVAVGIIWAVVKDILQQGSETVDINVKCLAIEVNAVSVSETSAGVYDVTFVRGSGKGDIGGIKMNVFNDDVSSGIIDFGSAISVLETQTRTMDTTVGGEITRIDGGNKIKFIVFFLDESGKEQLCSQIKEFEF